MEKNSIDITGFYNQQLNNWPIAADHYNALKQVKTKDFNFSGFYIRMQYNPKRLISSAAKIDKISIERRPCFLCKQNRPYEQKELPFNNDYLILINPFPIFPQHLTITSVNHLPQLIQGRFIDMLHLAVNLKGFTVLYNGPRCGASAPDHFHFQAVKSEFLPLHDDFKNNRSLYSEKASGKVKIYAWKNYKRGLITLTGTSADELTVAFDRLYNAMALVLPVTDEVMMNMLTCYKDGVWKVHIFPRIKHRPRQYFEEGDAQIVVSPAIIDLGGVLVVPREEDFIKLSSDLAADLYTQVCASDACIEQIILKIEK